MKTIGNVVITDGSKISYDKYIRRCRDLSDADRSLPTLIIGYKNAEKWIPDYNILTKSYPKQNMYWTFGKRERKFEYDDDIDKFYDFCIDNVCDGINYSYLNVVRFTVTDVKTLLTYIRGCRRKTIYNKGNRFLFCYDKKVRKVYGFSLDTCEYIGVRKDKILRIISENPHNMVINDGYTDSKRIRKFLSVKEYCIPVFYEYFNT